MDTQKQRHNLQENAGQTFQLYNINSDLSGEFFTLFSCNSTTHLLIRFRDILKYLTSPYATTNLSFFTTLCQEMFYCFLKKKYLSMLEIISDFHFINNDKIKEILIVITSSFINNYRNNLDCTDGLTAWVHDRWKKTFSLRISLFEFCVCISYQIHISVCYT